MLLSQIIFLPVIFALILLVLPENRWFRPIAFILAVAEFALSLTIFAQFNPHTAALQLVEKTPWIPEFGINYFVGIDGISLWLVLLTTFLTPLIILAGWKSIDKRVKGFHVCLFLLQTSMVGTFLAMDAILFYTFFEATLVPMYFMIGIWGGPRKIYATLKFFIYTMVGSVLMLIAIIYLMYMCQDSLGAMSASILDFYRLRVPFVGGSFLNPQTLMFFAFSLAFAIKVPIFPFHTWLPDAHVEAPTPGSVVLAAVLLKMGTYGFLRFAIPIFPEAAEYWSWLFMLIAVIGIIYGALVAMVQPDMKKLVAYSSVSHMGYVMLGLFALNAYGVSGGLYQMLNHGVSTGALFILVGMIYERTHSRQISDYGGLAAAMPIFAIFFFIVTLSSIALPLTNGFVGEFLVLMGGYLRSPVYVYVAVTGAIFAAAYMLWMYKRIFFGPAGKLVPAVADGHGHGHGSDHEAHSDSHAHPLLDLSWREIATLTPFVILIFWMGIFPNQFLNWSKASIDNFVNNHENYQLTIAPTEHPAQKIAQMARGVHGH